MNTHVSLLFIYACVTLCSMEKHIDSTKEKEKEKALDYDYYSERPTFETIEDIPKEYISYLTDIYDIKEDPLADIEGRSSHDYKTGEDKTKTEIEKQPEETHKKNHSEPVSTTADGLTEETVIDNNATDSNSTCKLCELREEDKMMRIEGIKKMILNKLGFSSSNLPNVTNKSIPRTPSFEKLVEQYEMQGDAPYGALEDEYLPEDDYYGNIHKAYTIGQQPPKEFGDYPSGGCYFDIPESVRAKKIQEATLWIYLERPKHQDKKSVTEIYIYVVPEKTKPAHILKGPVRYSKTSSYGWQEFKFTHIVHHWMKRPLTNKGLIIKAIDSNGRNLAVVPEEGSNENYYPTLEMATTDHTDKHHRSKRSHGNICTETERIEACCRYPLRVDFVHFGWDWVIAPTGYRANYCSGECRFRHIDDNPNAYLVQQTPTEGSGPCCTPNKFYPLAMLYFDHSHTVLYTYMQKMIVVRCGCA